jgi:predicted ATPase/DNA-binding CsgD family transcriptional regulator
MWPPVRGSHKTLHVWLARHESGGLEALADRRIVLRREVVENLSVADRSGPVGVRISAREAEVLVALGDHLSNAEIGARLFISVRTVESHVSSLLRKLQADDRRALAAIALNPHSDVVAGSALPASLTPFVGRLAERTALSAALSEHRLVTAVGPGGVGKTRLALRVAADVVDRFADGVCYVDLVPITDAWMVAPAIAEALGLGEARGGSVADNVATWLAHRETLIVLDNCEHLLDGVVVLLERLLVEGQGTSVLATSRARLLVPFEWVFLVPGLSVEVPQDDLGDAVQLFVERVVAAGGSPVRSGDTASITRISGICRALDGMALAIELAAARFPSLGLDGLEAGLSDRLRLLAGGSRIDDRHRSLRSMLDWSYALLDDAARAVVRRISVFAGSFTTKDASEVLGDWSPVATGDIPTILAGLVDHSLLIAIITPSGTQYRALETIRQYGIERLDEVGELAEVRGRHLDWCMDVSGALMQESQDVPEAWRIGFDQVADELRGALTWAAGDPQRRLPAYQLAMTMAHLSFVRGTPGESQRRYEQAAGLAVDDLAAADALRGAAGAAESRHVGIEALELRQRAAEAALRGGDRVAAAIDLARNGELINRGPGLMATTPAAGEAGRFVAQGWAVADENPRAQARLLVAEAFACDAADPGTAELLDRAIALAQQAGDPLAESAALDQLASGQLARGEVREAAATSFRRTRLLAPITVTASMGVEVFDALFMAAETAVAAGDLAVARAMSERLRDAPFYREEGHLATGRLIVVTVLAGDWSEAVELADRFRDGWERAGRPRAGNLSRGPYAAATMFGLRGDDDQRSQWLDIVGGLTTPDWLSVIHFGEFFDALLLLHRGQADQAVALMETSPEELNTWYAGMWRPWYAALWAEAAVLTRSDDVDDRVLRARVATNGNPIATAIVDRAAALVTPNGRDGLAVAADALRETGCRYQWARTLVMLGGEQRRQGEAMMAAMGATPMAWPQG